MKSSHFTPLNENHIRTNAIAREITYLNGLE